MSSNWNSNRTDGCHYPHDCKQVAERLRSFEEERWADSPFVGWLCAVFGLQSVANSQALCRVMADYIDPDKRVYMEVEDGQG